MYIDVYVAVGEQDGGDKGLVHKWLFCQRKKIVHHDCSAMQAFQYPYLQIALRAARWFDRE